jgi:hypothetical protein
MNILIGDLVNEIKKVFDLTKVRSVETIYEKESSSELKLVISINKILYDDVNIIYTKLIFFTDIEKIKITRGYFSYLYDINCEYIRTNFSTLQDFSGKISKIFNNNTFGENLKTLSKFVKSPSILINTWFKDNKITDISVINVIEEKISIMPCESLFFGFIIELNNNQSVKLSISKQNEKEFLFKFELNNKFYESKKSSLVNLVETIGDNLKNKIIM